HAAFQRHERSSLTWLRVTNRILTSGRKSARYGNPSASRGTRRTARSPSASICFQSANGTAHCSCCRLAKRMEVDLRKYVGRVNQKLAAGKTVFQVFSECYEGVLHRPCEIGR